MELQFYPPGYSPSHLMRSDSLVRGADCDQLAGRLGWGRERKLHRAAGIRFVTKSGRPVGPTGPDNATKKTFKPTKDVLYMSAGDRVTVSMFDTRDGFQVNIADQTTHETGTMTARIQRLAAHRLGSRQLHLQGRAVHGASDVLHGGAALPERTATCWPLWTATHTTSP